MIEISPRRDSYFDMLKFIAMFMVVFWHLYTWSSDVKSNVDYILNFIVAVNMPLFFAISGYFARRMIEGLDVDKLVKRLVVYLWPVLVFGILETVLEVVFSEITVHDFLRVACQRVFFGAWFFYALAICDCISLAAYCLTSALKGGRRWIVMSLIAYLLILFAPSFWYKNSTLNMIPFYLFGVVFLPRILNWDRHNFECIGFVLLGVYLLCVVNGGNFWQNGLAFYTNRIDIYHFQIKDVWLMAARFAYGICGMLGIMGSVRFLCRRIPRIAIVAPLGMLTLGIYYLHMMIVRHVLLSGGPRSLIVVFGESILVYLVSFFLLRFVKRFEFANKLIFGEGVTWPLAVLHKIAARGRRRCEAKLMRSVQ